MWQAEQVRQRLAALYPGMALNVLGLPGPADRGAHLAGAARTTMIRDLESAMAEGRADLAVHALKNLPSDVSPGYTIAGITAREDPRDAFVSQRFRSLDAMPDGAVLGTSSQRRYAQLRERHPALVVKALRGDIEARLRALDSGRCDALIVAASSLKRAGHASRIGALLEPDVSLPAPGQGALAIECRADDTGVLAALAPLEDPATRAAVTAERQLLATLEAGCTAPVGALAEVVEGEDGPELWLRGALGQDDGVRRLSANGPVDDPVSLGKALANELLERT